MHNRPAGKLKRSSASLTGGVFVGTIFAVIIGLVLTEIDLATRPVEWGLAIAAGLVFGGYVRLADL